VIKNTSSSSGLSSQTEKKLSEYRNYLQNVRGLALATVAYYHLIASQFFMRLDKREDLPCMSQLTSQDIEYFIRDTGNKVGRRTLNNRIAALRSLLRFLSANGEIPANLCIIIDTPRVYREEQLPRALSWETVCALLKSIDRSTAIGRRDYAILLLISTYGLRASEIVGLKLENIEWRVNQLRVFQRKTSTHTLLPLTSSVGESIIDYIRHGRPSVQHREIFVKHKVPNPILKAADVAKVFNNWSCHSGLSIPFKGVHCLRHSYAIHLLRQGTPLKTIGDLLGHRSFKSTCCYLRLNIEDLRAVPLCIPTLTSITKGEK